MSRSETAASGLSRAAQALCEAVWSSSSVHGLPRRGASDPTRRGPSAQGPRILLIPGLQGGKVRKHFGRQRLWNMQSKSSWIYSMELSWFPRAVYRNVILSRLLLLAFLSRQSTSELLLSSAAICWVFWASAALGALRYQSFCSFLQPSGESGIFMAKSTPFSIMFGVFGWQSGISIVNSSSCSSCLSFLWRVQNFHHQLSTIADNGWVFVRESGMFNS